MRLSLLLTMGGHQNIMYLRDILPFVSKYAATLLSSLIFLLRVLHLKQLQKATSPLFSHHSDIWP